MSKFKIISAVVMLIYSLAGFCDVPDQVDLHYTANIINRPCTISIPKTTILNMGDIDGNAMNAPGSVSPWLNTTIAFTQCDIETNIVVYSSASNQVYYPPHYIVYKLDDDSKPVRILDVSLDAYTTINGEDVNMYEFNIIDGAPLVITPIQRAISKYTSYTFPLKFRFFRNNFRGALTDIGDVYGVFVMTVEYK